MSIKNQTTCPCCNQVMAFVCNEHINTTDRLPSRVIVECINHDCLLFATPSTHSNLVTAYNALKKEQEGNQK